MKDNHFHFSVPAGVVVMFRSNWFSVADWIVHVVSVTKGDVFFPFVFVIAMERPFQ